MIVASFLLFLLGFVGIGAWAATRGRRTTADYLVASRDVNPWLMSLSAVSTQNSGFMFIGLIGVTYQTGVSSSWLLIGSTFGTYLAWLLVFRRVREVSGASDVDTFSGLIAGNRPVAILASLTTLAFLGTYAAAQLTAGSKALHVLFGWEVWVGAVIGAVIIILYCFAGGIRASIWTDSVQAVVMLVAMLVLFSVALAEAGGLAGLWRRLHAIDPKLVQIIPDLPYGFALYVIGWVVAGFGVVGQPHVMVRAMVIRDPEEVAVARRISMLWFVLFSAASIGVGLACRALLPEAGFDKELALPRLSMQLLPSILVGLVLAGLFAATMSTADSQVLSCSASLTQDVLGKRGSYWVNKAGTVLVALTALGIALSATFSGSASVFTLVILAWGALASGLGPLLLVRAFGGRASPGTGALMILTGIAVVLVWRYVLHLSHAVFEVLPGMAAGLAVYGAARLIGVSGRTSSPGDGA